MQPRRDIARMAIPPRDPHRRLRLPGRAVHSCPNSGPTAGHTYVALVQIPGDPAWWPLGTVVAPTPTRARLLAGQRWPAARPWLALHAPEAVAADLLGRALACDAFVWPRDLAWDAGPPHGDLPA